MKWQTTIAAVLALMIFVVLLPADLHGQVLKDQWNQSAKLIEEGKYQEALTVLKSMLANEELPDQIRPGVFFRMAYSYSALGDEKTAIVTWKKLLELAPDNGVAWANLGWSQYLTGEVKEAIASTQKAVELDETLFFAMANLGLYHLDLGQNTEAMAAYDKAVKAVKPGDEVDGVLEDLDKLEAKKPELKTIAADLRERFKKAAAATTPE